MKHMMNVLNVLKVGNNVKNINRMFLFLTVDWYLLISSINDSIMNSEIKIFKQFRNHFLILFVILEHTHAHMHIPNTHTHTHTHTHTFDEAKSYAV